jgi:SAM-dependent methyltransferase
MNDADLFFEIHTDLPREGPGNFASTQTAFSKLSDLPETPRILDIGCGPGQQTLDLAKLSRGTIVAIDNHLPYIDALARRAKQAGLSDRIDARVGDMSALDFGTERFDLIWAEGAIYSIGFETGLRQWKRWLNRPGWIAVTEITWLTQNPPLEVREFWEQDYPAMQTIEENLKTIERAGYEAIAHFTLPESAWLDDYYTPLERRVSALRQKYADRPEALAIIESEQWEIDLYRQYSDAYGYVFYLACQR